jgi:hypothetical protein
MADRRDHLIRTFVQKTSPRDHNYVGFQRLRAKIAARGNVRDPGAVAASIGRAKYGHRRFQKAAAQGKSLRGHPPARGGR